MRESARSHVVCAAAAMLHAGVGVYAGLAMNRPETFNRFESTDLDYLDPYAQAGFWLLFLVGVSLIVRWYKVGRTWRVALVPVLLLPAFLLVGIAVLLLGAAVAGR
jgi:hypothetical protein